MKMNSTKSKLMASLLVLVLCVTAFFGSTYAWFTDSVTSSGNKIQAGTLDVGLKYYNGSTWQEITDQKDPIFVYNNFEPGRVEVKMLEVVNNGTLALKWQAQLTAENGDFKLAEAIDVYVKEFATEADAVAGYPADRTLAGWTKLGTLKDFITGISSTTVGEIQPNGSEVMGMAFKMPEDLPGDDNVYQGLELGAFDIVIKATQLMAESDSYDNTYDENATYEPVIETETVTGTTDGTKTTFAAPVAPAAVAKNTTITTDGLDTAKTYTAEVSTENTLFNVKAGGAQVAEISVVIKENGVPFTGVLSDSKVYTVVTYISPGLAEVTVNYVDSNNTGLPDVDPTTVEYDPESGRLEFKTTHFSTFAVTGKAIAYDAVKGTALATPADVAAAAVKNNAEITIVPDITPADQEEIASNPNSAVLNEAKIGETGYLFLAGAFANAESGDKITLLKDAVLATDTTIVITSGKEITLDLAGYEVYGENTRTATHNFLFDAKGGTLTVKNGTVSMKHTGTNMAWNGAATIFDVTGGGVLNLDNVTVDNLGGTDMNFGVHLNNWGDATLKITDSTIKATYCPVRVFNSGPDMNNVTIENSKLVSGGNRAFWVHNYASADMGGKVYSGATAAYDEALVKARLKFDIFNNGNTFTAANATSPSPIRYGFNETIYFDEARNQLITTEAALKAAIAAGGTVTLGSDIEMDADNTVTVSNNVTLDLNGYTITGVSDKTGKNVNLFDANGGTLTVKDGTITVEHVGDNMGWSNSTNVFNVTAGGVLNIENATIKNLGGSDMAFAVHLNNWGEVTLNVKYSTLESTYIAVRVFNSGNDMNNVTIKNSTLAGKYCYWVHNYTLADFGTQDKVDKQKTLLNVDIFDGTNTFNNSGKAPVLYGFTDSIYCDANGDPIA